MPKQQYLKCYINSQSFIWFRQHMKTIQILQDGVVAHLANSSYSINVIYNSKMVYRITSEEKIVYNGEVKGMRKMFMERNATVGHYYVVMVDCNFGWSLFRVKSVEEEPMFVFGGKLMSENVQFKKLVYVYQMQGKLVFVFDKFKLLYVDIQNVGKDSKYLLSKQLLPYGDEPDYQHSKFSVENGFLPKQQEYELCLCHYHPTNAMIDLLFVVFQSSNNKLNSVFVLEYNRKKGYLVSGRNVLYNIQHRIVAVLETGVDNYYILQTQSNVILWKVGHDGNQQSNVVTYDIKIMSNLSKFTKKDSIAYFGVDSNNKALSITFDNSSKQLKIQNASLPSNWPKQTQLLQIHPFNKGQSMYLLTNKQQLLLYQNKSITKVISNDQTHLQSSTLHTNPYYNFLVVTKQRGQSQQKIVYGNHLFAYELQHYAHGIMLQAAEVMKVEGGKDGVGVYVTSPIIGIKKVQIHIKEPNKPSAGKANAGNKIVPVLSFDLSLSKVDNCSNQQTLYLNQNIQITNEDIINPTNNQPITKISKLFDNATDYVTKALYMQSQIIILAIADQLHIFTSKYIRKYIYCCNGQIKNIYGLNDFNLLGVQLFDNGGIVEGQQNVVLVLILEEDRANKIKTVVVPQVFDFIRLGTVINTADYKLNLFGNRLIVCSNDSLHRYQLDKITVRQFWLTLPQTTFNCWTILPVFNLATTGRSSQSGAGRGNESGAGRSSNEFVLINREQPIDEDVNFDEVEVYLCSFNSKYLFEKIQLSSITVNYQRILTFTELPRDKCLFVIAHNQQDGSKAQLVYKNIIIVGQQYVSVCSIKLGKIQLQWLSNCNYLLKQINKLQALPNQISALANSLAITKPLFLYPTSKPEHILIRNSRQLYYAKTSPSQISLISYYSLMNDDFVTFRNNLSITQLNDDQFMHIFNQKLLIKDLKYLNDRTIFLLFETCIVVLQIGFNNSLVVRQQIKFKDSMTDVVRIQQFMQNYDDESIYMRESHGRIFLLKFNGSCYQIVFHSFMDEDVLLFGRVSNWNRRERSRMVEEQKGRNYQELILKKDGQLIVKSIEKNSPENNKLIYL